MFCFGIKQYMLVWEKNKWKVKWSRYRTGVAQTVGTGMALLFHDRGTRRVVSSTLRPHFTSGKDPVPILQEAGRASGPFWRAENLVPTGIFFLNDSFIGPKVI